MQSLSLAHLQSKWQQQLDTEANCVARGISKIKGDTNLAGVVIIQHCFKNLCAAFEAVTEAAVAGNPGRDAIAAYSMARVKPDVLAFVTLRTIIGSLQGHMEPINRTKLARIVGQEISVECLHLQMRNLNSKVYDYWKNRADTAPNARTRARCEYRLKKVFEDSTMRDDSVLSVRIGLTALGLVFEHTDLLCQWQETAYNRNKCKPKTMIMCELNPSMHEVIAKVQTYLGPIFVKYLPMVVQPTPWSSVFKGGYIGDCGRDAHLLRRLNYRRLEELDRHKEELSDVFKAVTAIQNTPWRINKAVFNCMCRCFHRKDSDKFAIPSEVPIAFEKFVATMSAAEKQDFAFRAQATQSANNMRSGVRIALSFKLATATEFEKELAIWFPHNLDWRGRVYPIASYLSPQGDDYSRALLEFANGELVDTEEAVQWLALEGSSRYGFDKTTIPERLNWVVAHKEDIQRAARGQEDCPEFWTKADKPWSFLAWCIEWSQYLALGHSFKSHQPVSMDGSCNGLQHYAAMLRDSRTAKAVNLEPSDRPSDVYTKVAERVQNGLEAVYRPYQELSPSDLEALARLRTEKEMHDEDTSGGKEETNRVWNAACARWVDGKVTRSLVKRPVMTYPYSVSKYGMCKQIEEVLRELAMKHECPVPWEHIGKAARMLRDLVYEAVRTEVVAAARAMDWLQSIAKQSQSVLEWTTPIGLPIRQAYMRKKYVHIYCHFGKSRIKCKIPKEDQRLDTRAQVSAIAPNFVHSLDASHLMATVLRAYAEGINDFHMIHDSYGCHAAKAAKLAKILREEFIKLHENRPLEHFYQQVFVSMSPLIALPPPPKEGDFDLNRIRASRFFFL